MSMNKAVQISIPPVIRLSIIFDTLFAMTADTLAAAKVAPMVINRIFRSGKPLMTKWDTAPISAVKVIMKTLVPTPVLNSYPATTVRVKSIINPPPAP